MHVDRRLVTDTKPSRRAHGEQAERYAQLHLESRGLAFITRNYRSRFGEIDLVMRDGDTLVFVEVRMRAHDGFGTPAESVTARKQERLRATAEHYRQHDRWALNAPCRFDIVAITGDPASDDIDWLRDAF